MALQTVATMTADELLVMPHNGYRYELIKGELRQMAPAGRQHGRIAATIYRGFDDIRILTEGDTIDGGDVVPGWQLPLADVF